MNLADMATALTFIGCALGGGAAGLAGHAGWFTPLLVVLGAALGFGCACGVRAASYAILFASCKQKNVWLTAPLFFAYLIVPMLLAFASMALVGATLAWVAERVF